MGKENTYMTIPELGIIDLGGISNRNERRVQDCLLEVLEEFPDFAPDRVDIQDIYALSLNLLPARYTQAFSIVLNEPVSMDDVRDAVRQAIRRVRSSPK